MQPLSWWRCHEARIDGQARLQELACAGSCGSQALNVGPGLLRVDKVTCDWAHTTPIVDTCSTPSIVQSMKFALRGAAVYQQQ